MFFAGEELDIENLDRLLRYLQEAGRIGAGDKPRFTVLAGGVSNRTVLVELGDGRAFVLKQALERLRVQTDWRSDPRRIEKEALALQWLPRLANPESFTRYLFQDHRHHLLAMEAVPRPHENWKSMLLQGNIQRAHVEEFACLLATLHRRSRERRDELAKVFEDRTFFQTLRLEPYYAYTASQVREAADFLARLIQDTAAERLALVHGDYSPKNVLIHRDRLVLLDHEVIHFGDPAFDLGFSMTHLLSKALHLPENRAAFFAGAHLHWRDYRTEAGELPQLPGFEERAVRHTLACLLARVAGRSPLEYLGQAERDLQKRLVLVLLAKGCSTMPELIEAFCSGLRHS